MRLKGMVLGAALALAAMPSLAEEVVLKAVTGLPGPTPVAQVFLQYVERVNAAGTGIVRIDYLGGPEVTPPPRLAAALERGLIDIMHAPGSFYAGSVKEIDALLAANRPIEEIRASGAYELMNDLWGAQMNARVLGWFDSSVRFNMYLKKPPVVTETSVSLEGMRLFTTPTYRDFQEALGATPVAIGIGEILTALERGVIDGYGWPDYGLVALGFGRETKYRIDPPYYSGNVLALINVDSWNALPDAAKAVLTEQAIAWEAEAPAFIAGFKTAEEKALVDGGMEIVDLPPAAAKAYLDAAYQVLWTRLDATGSPDARRLADMIHDPARQ
jgi:TRAP-type transport system periplasmic protein